MNVYEKYYRRSYNSIAKLLNTFRYGYSEKAMMEYINELIFAKDNNNQIFLEERSKIIYTLIISLLGLNKESMENTGKITKYQKSFHTLNMRSMNLENEVKRKLELFDSERVLSTDFDDWLSITLPILTDTTNYDHLKRVRNGLLHSNFYIDDSNFKLNIAHIKIKNYYEAEIIEPEFNAFIINYFSNLSVLGLSEQIYTHNFSYKNIIKNKTELIEALRKLVITKLNYSNVKDIDGETPESIIVESAFENGTINYAKYHDRLFCNSNFELDINKCQEMILEEKEITHVLDYIEKEFGNTFYEMDERMQKEAIIAHVEYMINPKKDISAWLIRFIYLFNSILGTNIDRESFCYDGLDSESCYPALLILKSYLIIYRLQNNNLDKLDYSKINFDFNDPKIDLLSKNADDSLCVENLFLDSFNKIKKRSELTDLEIWNNVVCEVFRNSLAHGNAFSYIDLETGEQYIEFKDINKKKGTIRVIRMSLEKLEQFLNSDAFLPKHCKQREDSIVLSRKKSE